MNKSNDLSDGADVKIPEIPDSGREFETRKEFDAALENLLERGHQSGIAFDRSWTFRNSTTRPNPLVEISELARRPNVLDSEE